MKKFSGSSFKLKLKVEAPIGGRAGTAIKLLEKLLNNTEYFTVTSTDMEYYKLNIIYHEMDRKLKK